MRIIVREWQRVLVYRDGKFEVELAPGRHRVRMWRRHRLTVTVRPRLVHVPLQEVLTADGLAVKVSLTAGVRVADARTWHEAADDPDAFLYVALLPSLLSYLIYNNAADVVGPARAGQAITLLPLFGALLSAALLGEPLHAYHFAGMALILLGIVVGALAPRPARS